MIYIGKDGNEAYVTEAAYKEYFKPFGWETLLANRNIDEANFGDSEGHMDALEDALLYKPASEMTGKELKKYAKLVGITGQFDSKEELMEAVIEHQKQKK